MDRIPVVAPRLNLQERFSWKECKPTLFSFTPSFLKLPISVSHSFQLPFFSSVQDTGQPKGIPSSYFTLPTPTSMWILPPGAPPHFHPNSASRNPTHLLKGQLDASERKCFLFVCSIFFVFVVACHVQAYFMNICTRPGVIFPTRSQTPSEMGPYLINRNNVQNREPRKFSSCRGRDWKWRKLDAFSRCRIIAQQSELSGVNPTHPSRPKSNATLVLSPYQIFSFDSELSLLRFPRKGIAAAHQIFLVLLLNPWSDCISLAP